MCLTTLIWWSDGLLISIHPFILVWCDCNQRWLQNDERSELPLWILLSLILCVCNWCVCVFMSIHLEACAVRCVCVFVCMCSCTALGLLCDYVCVTAFLHHIVTFRRIIWVFFLLLFSFSLSSNLFNIPSKFRWVLLVFLISSTRKLTCSLIIFYFSSCVFFFPWKVSSTPASVLLWLSSPCPFHYFYSATLSLLSPPPSLPPPTPSLSLSLSERRREWVPECLEDRTSISVNERVTGWRNARQGLMSDFVRECI